ncbi:MAG: hypothetical protein LUQ33_02355, partial [Methanoregulaceae archaeon]|nr:hypothetical protein [Methanoregulaceae archaeon]
EQCNAAGKIDNDYLENCRYEQAGKGPFYCPDTPFCGEDRRVYDPMRVAVPDFFFRIMIMTVITLVIMIIIGCLLVVFLEYHMAIPALLFFIIMSAVPATPATRSR